MIAHINSQMGGSFETFIERCLSDGVTSTFMAIWPTPWDPVAWKYILSFMAIQLALMRIVPGKEFKGPLTPGGNVPVYQANGMQCFVITMIGFVVGVHFDIFPGGFMFDKINEIISALNVFSFAFCAFLYIKGTFMPSSTDSGNSGNPIFDFYWGTELYPMLMGWHLKQFTNCRFGMMLWPVAIVSYAYKQQEELGYTSDSMIVSVIIQLVYIAKFFWWETGYLSSIDIMHDRAGYYICWGCLVFVPCFYTSQSMYLVRNPVQLGLPLASAILLAGWACVWANYDSDRMRQHFRQCNGEVQIWGAEPKMVKAKYTTETGIKKTSLLLASGWWGLSRHFHYLPEVGASFFWSLPALFDNSMPYLYTIYLSVLLLDRAYRDEGRCSAKYGTHWKKYCKMVPYRIVPGLL